MSLDVLRAVAVLLVLFRHAPAPLPDDPSLAASAIRTLKVGGWVGVDLFFVLSGFLISGLLFSEYARTGGIRVGRFLLRRSLKIYPAFYVLIAVTVVQALWVAGFVPPNLLFSEVFYLQNYLPRMWDHTWSLAVEEHFYLLLPPLLLALKGTSVDRANPFRRFPLVVGVVAVACLGLRSIRAQTPYAFDSHVAPTHLRIDALMFGCLLAYALHFAPEAFARLAARWRLPLGAGGILCLLPAFAVPLEVRWMHVVGLTLFSLGSGAIVVASFGAIRATRPARVAAFIGRHSYSIYLWHLPVLIWVVPLTEIAIGFAMPPGIAFAFYLLVACGVGIAMARLVELPVVRVRDRWFPR